mmetsp:Transcript_26034/g.48532  ORF Transcript_26034/g.48532 Transcript_26034/m.48532 type:complete len:204 (+) Transcript_26034:275-886(+)
MARPTGWMRSDPFVRSIPKVREAVSFGLAYFLEIVPLRFPVVSKAPWRATSSIFLLMARDTVGLPLAPSAGTENFPPSLVHLLTSWTKPSSTAPLGLTRRLQLKSLRSICTPRLKFSRLKASSTPLGTLGAKVLVQNFTGTMAPTLRLSSPIVAEISPSNTDLSKVWVNFPWAAKKSWLYCRSRTPLCALVLALAAISAASPL